MRQRATVRRFWGRKKKRGKTRGGGGGRRGEKNRRKRKRVKPDWECLPRVVLVTLNYKWSLTFQAKTHNHNIIPMMHVHWQATPLSPGIALATNLCPLLSFSSSPLSLSFQSPEWRILQTLPSFALSIFLALVSECLHCVTASCNLHRNSPFPFFSPPPSISFLSLCEKKILHPPSLNSFHAQLSQFLSQLAFHILFPFTLCCCSFHPRYLRFPVCLLFPYCEIYWPHILSQLIRSLHLFLQCQNIRMISKALL